ncbi:MAG: iron ABC transporter permease [Chloroflexia bacterium]|nr:iron ABC transporter permease [Chloroflexia bacterium]
MNSKYLKWLFQALAVLLFALLAILISFYAGEIKPSWQDLVDLLTRKEGGIELSIIREIRLPRIFLGFAIGAALSLAGTILQGVYRNPLVEPYTLGISGGAALGVALAIVFNLQQALGRIILPFRDF